MWQCQKFGQKYTRRGHAKQCKCQKWCTMCSKLVNNVNKHILLSITEGGHGGYRCGMEACTKVFSRAAKLKKHTRTCAKRAEEKLTQAAECGNNGCGKVFARAADLRRHVKACKGQQHGSHATRPVYWFRLFAILNNFPYIKFPRAKFPRHIRKFPMVFPHLKFLHIKFHPTYSFSKNTYNLPKYL